MPSNSSSSSSASRQASAARPTIELKTTVQKVLLFQRMSVREELGRLGEFELDLLSQNDTLTAQDVLAKNVTVTMETVQGVRYFNGYITRFSGGGMHGRHFEYHATVRPWLWFLTRTADCRIFQNQSIPDIIEAVLEDHSIADYELDLKGSYDAWEYCVQYRETDFNFISRLMEQEGIYYYMRHADGRHTMVITDAISGHGTFEGYANILYRPHLQARAEQEVVTRWTFGYEVQPGSYVIDDYNFTEPAVEEKADRVAAKTHDLADYEIYDYPGEYEKQAEGHVYARTRLEELHARYELAQGSTTARGLCTGYTFKLENFPRKDQNREYLVVSATHELEYTEHEAMQGGGGTSYACTFTALSAPEPFRPARTTPKPVVQGIQTATVVGPDGDEIHTDKYGRIKVRFHWDRPDDVNGEDRTCFIRVAQPWAGKNWGATFIPRIGQEVVVSFLEGDPDRPLVTGSVYNEIQKPPYLGEGLDGKHKNDPNVSGIKTNSTKGGSGYNELRFDDNAGKEQIFMHAQHNFERRVKNDDIEFVGNDKHLHIVNDRIEKIDDNAYLEVVVDQHNTVSGAKKETIVGKHELLVKADQNAEVKGKASLTVGGDLHEKVTGNTALDSGQAIHIKAGMTIVIEAGTQISLKVGGNFVDIGPSGVTIVGTMVLINSGGAAGSGSGSSPTAPAEATKKAPTEPDDSASGSKSAQ